MGWLFKEISVNINTFNTYASIVFLLFIIIVFVIYLIFFKESRLIGYGLLIMFNMIAYLLAFMFLVNSQSAFFVVFFTKLLYSLFMLLAITSVFSISSITHSISNIIRGYTLLCSNLFIIVIWASNSLLIRDEIWVATYYTAAKGPLFIAMQLYVLSIGIVMVIDFTAIYENEHDKFMEFWPLYVGIIFFTFYTNFQGFIAYINLKIRPTLYVNTLFFASAFFIYVFMNLKKTIRHREELYETYLYDELTQVYSRSFILDEIKKSP